MTLWVRSSAVRNVFHASQARKLTSMAREMRSETMAGGLIAGTAAVVVIASMATHSKEHVKEMSRAEPVPRACLMNGHIDGYIIAQCFAKK